MYRKRHLYQSNLIPVLAVIACALYTTPTMSAVVQRTAPATTQQSGRTRAPNPTLSRTSPAATATNKDTTTAQPVQSEPVAEPAEPTAPAPAPIMNKDGQFSTALASTGTAVTSDASATNLARLIREQRAALDAADNIAAAQSAISAGTNVCDRDLRQCMTETCGRGFANCAGDTDTTWGTKIDRCRRNTKCTGAEYARLAPEIKADRDMNARLAGYDAVIDCGNKYNACIEGQCGATFDKCLGKSANDAAISKCASIARDCTRQDNGLAARAMSAMATLRVNAEKRVATDEQRLYSLRDQMRTTCDRIGAMFDERTFSCVYTVKFLAGNDNEFPTSTRKAYAGDTFDCTQEWFGLDVTTFKENALRATREQTSASSAFLGSGVGVGVGALTSGAIDRAIDTHKAEKELKDAQKAAKDTQREDKQQAQEEKHDNQQTAQESGGGNNNNENNIISSNPDNLVTGREIKASNTNTDYKWTPAETGTTTETQKVAQKAAETGSIYSNYTAADGETTAVRQGVKVDTSAWEQQSKKAAEQFDYWGQTKEQMNQIQQKRQNEGFQRLLHQN